MKNVLAIFILTVAVSFGSAFGVSAQIKTITPRPVEIPTKINPAVLAKLKKANPKMPVAVKIDEVTKIPRVRLADETYTQLLPLAEVERTRSLVQQLPSISNKMLQQNRVRQEVVFNSSWQTPARHQGRRGTCAVFAAVAALEAAYKREMGRDFDISEQHVNWLKNVTWMSSDFENNRSPFDPRINENLPGSMSAGVSCTGILQMLTRFSAAEETLSPYDYTEGYDHFQSPFYVNTKLGDFKWWEPNYWQNDINEWNFAAEQFPDRVRTNPKFGVQNVISLTEREFRRPEVLENLLAEGFELVFAMTLYSPGKNYNFKNPVWRLTEGAEPGGGHCMTIVGYDSKRRFFIVKNSWGKFNYEADQLDPEWRDVAGRYDNYVLIDYDYLTSKIYEAGYMKGVRNTEEPRREQELMGSWDVELRKKNSNTVVLSGTLHWRQNPPFISQNGAPHIQLTRRSFRIGDLTLADSQSFRVNGELSEGQKLVLYIDFNKPNLPYFERGGLHIEARLQNDAGRLSINSDAILPSTAGVRSIRDVPLSDLVLTARHR